MTVGWGVRASVIRRRGDGQAESFDRVKSTAERKVNFDAVWAASVETEDRDDEFATLGIKITSRFQIRSRITGLDRPCGRSALRENPELGELEARYIINAGVDETDEWRWTFRYVKVSNDDLPGLGCNGEHAQHRSHVNN